LPAAIVRPAPATYTIRTWLFLLVVACIVPALLATTLLIYQIYQRDRASAERIRIGTARALMQAVDRELSSAQSTLLVLASSPYLSNGDLAAFYRQAQALQHYYPRHNFVLCDTDGQQLVNTLRPYGAALPHHGNPAQLHRVLATGQAAVSDLYRGGVTHRPLISIDVPVRVGGRIRYDLAMGFYPEQLGDILLRQHIPSDWVAAILDSKGYLVARTWQPERFVGQRAVPDLVRRIAQVPEDSIETITLEGVPAMSAFSRSSYSHWAVAIGIPRATLYQQLRASLREVSAVAMLTLLFGLMLAHGMGRRITAAIHALREPAAQLGRGESVAIPRLPLKEANDVADAFQMASALLQQRTQERDRAEQAERDSRAARHQLEQSEAFLRGIFEEAPNAVLLVDAAGRIMRANAEAEKLFGYSRAQLLTMHEEDLIPGEARTRHREARASYFANPVRRPMGSGMHLFGLRADGGRFPIDVMLSPLQTAATPMVIATMRDITELRRHEEQVDAALREKEMLLKELYHRVKNNLQVIASLINLQQRDLANETARHALQETTERVRAMALVHEKFYQSRNLSSIALDGYIADLCRQLGTAAGAEQHGILLHTETVALEIELESAIPLGLLLNELISNSLKHAFPNGRGGHILVRLQVLNDTTARLEVADDGIGLPGGKMPTSSSSLGLKLVAALAKQLDGFFALESQRGTVASLTFPITGHTARSAATNAA
jgi:PAS domain S-box-containing protein